VTISREEFDRVVNRLDQIDAGGTRGVAVLAVQVQELAKDMARHEEKHDRQETARAANRKWTIMAFIGAVAAIDGPIVTVVLALHGGH